MDRMLRHIPTGDLYIYTSALAERSDMEFVVEKAVEEAPVADKKPRGKKGELSPSGVLIENALDNMFAGVE